MMMNNLTNHIYSWFGNNNENIKKLANNEILQIANDLNGIFSQVKNDNHKLTLPKIVVVGTQSSGKSTILNGIMALDILPTGKNMVTRTPLDIKLHKINSNESYIELGIYNDNGWNCEKKINLTLPNATKEEILLVRQYISNKTVELAGNEMNVSNIPINLQIYSPNVPDLSLVDLPGLIMVACTDKGQPYNMPKQIEQLVESYINVPNTIILSIMQSRPDLETDLGLALIKKNKCNNTIGVLTKPDLMNNDCHVGNYLSGNISKDLMLFFGYFVIKNSIINDDYDIVKILGLEKNYFSNHPEYSKTIYNDKVGYNSLIKELIRILINAIKENLPVAIRMLSEIEAEFNKKQLLLGKCPPTTKETQIIELNSYVNYFNKKFNDCVESNDTVINIGKKIKLIFDDYRNNILNIDLIGEKYNNDYFNNMIMGFEGYHLSNYVSPIILLERCITDYNYKPIYNGFREPCIDCLNSIIKSLSVDIVNILYLDEFAKYPLLVNLVINTINDNLLIPYSKIVIEQIDILLQCEIDYIWTNDVNFLELLNKFKLSNLDNLDNLKILLNSYFDTIKKNIINNVPKIIMSFIIRNIQKNLINYLTTNIVNENNLNLLKENPKVEDDRNYCNSILSKINSVKKIIDLKLK